MTTTTEISTAAASLPLHGLADKAGGFWWAKGHDGVVIVDARAGLARCLVVLDDTVQPDELAKLETTLTTWMGAPTLPAAITALRSRMAQFMAEHDVPPMQV